MGGEGLRRRVAEDVAVVEAGEAGGSTGMEERGGVIGREGGWRWILRYF